MQLPPHVLLMPGGQESYKPPGRKPRGVQQWRRALQDYGDLTVGAVTLTRSQLAKFCRSSVRCVILVSHSPS